MKSLESTTDELHKNVKKYLSYEKHKRDELISKYSSLKENYETFEEKNVDLSIKELAPAIYSLSEGIITHIKDINYIKKNNSSLKDNFNLDQEISKAYSEGLDKTKNAIRYMLSKGDLDRVDESLDEWFAIFFKQTDQNVPLNPPYFIQIKEINSAYNKALEIQEENKKKINSDSNNLINQTAFSYISN